VVQACALAQRSLGSPFPCLDVNVASGPEPGFAVLRAPGSPTHIIVAPLVRIPGIESSVLQKSEAGTYWRAALNVRPLVQAGAPTNVPLSSIGLAINSDLTRSQDQLHIHAECIKPRILITVRAQSAGLTDVWQPLPEPIDRSPFFARRASKDEITGGNLFAELARLPGEQGDLSGVTAAVIGLDPGGDEGGFVVLGSRSRRRTVEGFFQDDCTRRASTEWLKERGRIVSLGS
jgi:CDP-diacylglycerol pyrophosphatase